MNKQIVHNSVTILISLVWLANGLFCKVLNVVPRHQQIIGEILRHNHSRLFAILIGVSEVLMAIWIISRFKSRWNAIIQMIIVMTMNIMEFVLVPDLLLWGKFNIVFAILFVFVVYCNEFIIQPKKGIPV